MSDTRYEYQSEFAKKFFGRGLEEGRLEGRQEGRLEGRQEGVTLSLLRILERRSLSLSPEERQRIERCSDLATLERWLDRAVEVNAASELFDG